MSIYRCVDVDIAQFTKNIKEYQVHIVFFVP